MDANAGACLGNNARTMPCNDSLLRESADWRRGISEENVDAMQTSFGDVSRNRDRFMGDSRHFGIANLEICSNEAETLIDSSG